MTQPTPIPAPTPAPTPPVPDPTNFVARYWLNIAVIALTALSVIGSFIVANVPNGQFLGFSDVAWHWVSIFFGACSALSAFFNPSALQRPTQARLKAEAILHHNPSAFDRLVVPTR